MMPISRLLVGALVVLLCTATPAYAQKSASPTAGGEVDALLDRLDGRGGANAQPTRSAGPFTYPVSGAAKLLPDLSVIGSVTGGWISDDPAFDTGHDPARSGFTLQEIEVALQSAVDPYFRADVFIGFSEDEVELEEAYLTAVAPLKGLQIRGGKFLLPFGRQNIKHLEQRPFIDNMLMNFNFFGPEALDEIGVEASYTFPTAFYLQLQGAFTNGINDTSFGGANKEDFLYQGRLSTSVDLSPVTTLLFGASSAGGYNASGSGNKTLIYGGDALLKFKPGARTSLTWQTEYAWRTMEQPGTATLNDGGLYSYVDVQFMQRWHAGFRYDQMGLPSDAIGKRWRISPALTFDPTEFSRLRLQIGHEDGTNATPIHAVMLQAQFNMGPHGAHAF